MNVIVKRAAGVGVVLTLLLIVIFAAGCGDPTAVNDPAFPEFVYRSEESLIGYRIAAANQAILESVPCYCGCKQDPEKYQNLKDCFYNRQTGDFDEHAAGCTTCLDEAMDIGQWQGEGLSLLAIRERIDAKYSERGDPTDTPMPE